MKISISNIAWDKNLFPYFLDFIKSKGCSGVEIAPSCVWGEPKTSCLPPNSEHKSIRSHKYFRVFFLIPFLKKVVIQVYDIAGHENRPILNLHCL